MAKWMPPNGFTGKVHQIDVKVGTELNVVQEGLPSAIPGEACYFGWQESLVLLSKLFEAKVPD